MRNVLGYAKKGAIGKFDEFSGSWNENEINLMNCKTCDHKRHPDGGHCYMFRTAPPGVCHQHTGYKLSNSEMLQKLKVALG